MREKLRGLYLVGRGVVAAAVAAAAAGAGSSSSSQVEAGCGAWWGGGITSAGPGSGHITLTCKASKQARACLYGEGAAKVSMNTQAV
jgi:hypothetical protein